MSIMEIIRGKPSEGAAQNAAQRQRRELLAFAERKNAEASGLPTQYGEEARAARGIAEAAQRVAARQEYRSMAREARRVAEAALKAAPAAVARIRHEVEELQKSICSAQATSKAHEARLVPLVERQQQLMADRDGAELKARQEMAQAAVSGDAARLAKAEAGIFAARNVARQTQDQLASVDVQLAALREAKAEAEQVERRSASALDSALGRLKAAEAEPVAIRYDLAVLDAIEAAWECATSGAFPSRALTDTEFILGASQALLQGLPHDQMLRLRCNFSSAGTSLNVFRAHPFEAELEKAMATHPAVA